MDYVIEINSKKTSTEDIVKKYRKKQVTFLAVGGDGTINRVLNSMVGSKNVLGFIPYGTGNDFYKTCQEILTKKINRIDLIQINQKYFINVACFGIDADIGNNDEIIHSKWIPEKQRYNMGILAHFLKYKVKHAKAEYNHKVWEDEMTTIAVCNGRYYGGGYKVGYHSKLTNGKVDVYLVNKMGKISMAKLIKGMNKGLHEHSNHTTKAEVKEIKLTFDQDVTCNIDGEKLTSKKFHIKVIPKGVTIYYDQTLIEELNKR